MTGKIGITFLDDSGETSRVDINVDTLNSTTITDILAQAEPLTASTLAYNMAALTLCKPSAMDVVASKETVAGGLPTSRNAQRETGLMVTYQDTVSGKNYHITIPGPDWATLGVAGTDKINPANAAWQAFVLSFETWAVSPTGGAVTVTGGRFVGRNR